MQLGQKLLKVYNDFSGGWNADAAPDSLKDNELALADNAVLDERGAISKRKGTIPLNSTSYGAQVEQLIEWPRNDGTKILLAVVGTTLARIADDGTKTDLQALNRNQLGYFFLQDKFYFVDGSEYRVYDGTTVSAVTPDSSQDNDLAPIKRCKFMMWHPKSYRIFAAGDSQDKAALYFSESNKANYFKNTSKLYPTTADGPVTGLALFGDALLVFYQNSIWAWKGSDPTTGGASWEKLPAGQGTLAARSIAFTPNTLSFLGAGGIFSLSLGLLDYSIVMMVSQELVKNRAKDKVTSVIRSIVHPETSCAVFDPYNERYMLAYGDDSANSRNNKVLVLDWGLQSFTRFAGWQVNDFCRRANGDLLIATNGYILKAHQGYKDWDVNTATYIPIDFNIKTKQWNLGYPFNRKKNKRLFMAAKQYEVETSHVDITVTGDYVEKFFGSISLDESLVWGEDWGNVWGWIDLITKEMRVSMKAQRFHITARNNIIDEPITLYGFAWEYKLQRPKGVRA